MENKNRNRNDQTPKTPEVDTLVKTQDVNIDKKHRDPQGGVSWEDVEQAVVEINPDAGTLDRG